MPIYIIIIIAVLAIVGSIIGYNIQQSNLAEERQQEREQITADSLIQVAAREEKIKQDLLDNSTCNATVFRRFFSSFC